MLRGLFWLRAQVTHPSAVALVEDVGQLQQRRMSVHEGAQVGGEGGGLYHAADEQRGPRGKHVGLEIVDDRIHRQQRHNEKGAAVDERLEEGDRILEDHVQKNHLELSLAVDESHLAVLLDLFLADLIRHAGLGRERLRTAQGGDLADGEAAAAYVPHNLEVRELLLRRPMPEESANDGQPRDERRANVQERNDRPIQVTRQQAGGKGGEQPRQHLRHLEDEAPHVVDRLKDQGVEQLGGRAGRQPRGPGFGSASVDLQLARCSLHPNHVALQRVAHVEAHARKRHGGGVLVFEPRLEGHDAKHGEEQAERLEPVAVSGAGGARLVGVELAHKQASLRARHRLLGAH
eukprot:scaffold82903_cov67-Phaeocystis_antarctica.AAC.4